MRVLFVTPYIPNSLRTRPYYFLKTLAAQHQITLVTPIFTRHEHLDADKLKDTLPGLEVIAIPCLKTQAIKNSLLAVPNQLPMQARYCYSLDLIRTVRRLVQTRQFDVAHVEHFRAAYIGEELAKLGLPAVYDAVDCISLLVERTLRQGPLKNRLVSKLELKTTQRYESHLLNKGGFQATCITSQEDATALENLANVNPGTIKVISNGVDLNYFSPSLDKSREAATVIFSGKMSYHANATAARYLVKEIWPLVHKALPHARLWIVGSHPPKDLTALSGRNGLKVTGYVPDLRSYLQQATLAVAPMVYSVGIQNKVLEAMACGTPTIATDDITRSIKAQDNQELCLVAPGQPVEFAHRIIELIQDKEKAARIGEKGRNFVAEHYSWARATRQLEQLWTTNKLIAQTTSTELLV